VDVLRVSTARPRRDSAVIDFLLRPIGHVESELDEIDAAPRQPDE
jgi:hypothetical protein